MLSRHFLQNFRTPIQIYGAYCIVPTYASKFKVFLLAPPPLLMIPMTSPPLSYFLSFPAELPLCEMCFGGGCFLWPAKNPL